MNVHDADLEAEVIHWCARDGDARALLFEELAARDFWHPALRGLFLAMRRAYLAGALAHMWEIRDGRALHTWSGLCEEDRAELAAICDDGGVRVYFPSLGAKVVGELRTLTKKRVVLATAERERLGEPVDYDAIHDWMIGDVA